jgi:hypothetical protein
MLGSCCVSVFQSNWDQIRFTVATQHDLYPSNWMSAGRLVRPWRKTCPFGEYLLFYK